MTSKGLMTWCGRWNIFTARKRNCGKVMFLHVSIIPFTGVCLPKMPWERQTNPIRRQSPLRKQTCLLRKQTPPQKADQIRRQNHLRRQTSPHPCPQKSKAGGTHPTGVHTCFCILCVSTATSLLHDDINWI